MTTNDPSYYRHIAVIASSTRSHLLTRATSFLHNIHSFDVKREDVVDDYPIRVNCIYVDEESDDAGAVMRIVDGVIVVVDCTLGVNLALETLIRMAVHEECKPFLLLENLQNLIELCEYNGRLVFEKITAIVNSVNLLLDRDILLAESVGFISQGSEYDWGFCVEDVAGGFSDQFGVLKGEMATKLTTEYFSSESAKWTKQKSKGSVIGFIHFILNPLIKLMNKDGAADLSLLGITDQIEDTHMDTVLHNRYPLSKLVANLCILLPSPDNAQRDFSLIIQSADNLIPSYFRTCSPTDPLFMITWKTIKLEATCYTIARIFSGTMHENQQIKESCQRQVAYIRKIYRIGLDGSLVRTESVDAGNLVVFEDLNILSGRPTLIRDAAFTGFITMRPIKEYREKHVLVDVEPADASQLPVFLNQLREILKLNFGVENRQEDQYHTLAARNYTIIQKCLDQFQIALKQVSNRFSYMETVTAVSSQVVMTKSPNRHNRLFMQAEPLDPIIVSAIEKEPRFDLLYDHFNWDKQAEKLWSFSFDNTSILVEKTKHVQYINEIKDSVCSAFQWASKEGVLIESPIRGARFNLVDVTYNSDAIHRGGGQIIPTARRCLLGSQLVAQPRIMESINTVEVTLPTRFANRVASSVIAARGLVFNQTDLWVGTVRLTCQVPTSEYDSLEEDLHKLSSDIQIFSVFNHWQVFGGDPLDPESEAGNIVKRLRELKGDNRSLSIDRYCDHL